MRRLRSDQAFMFETSFDENLLDDIMDGLNSCDSVERMMAFLTATINVLTRDQLVQMVANLNHNRYIDTFPDGRLEQRAANLTAAIQMYEKGFDPCPRVNQSTWTRERQAERCEPNAQ